jgi:3-oxoacyl-[acyl-carrier-protein] synthase-1
VRLFLNDIGIVNALGGTKSAVLRQFQLGESPGMVWHGPLSSGRSTWVGSVGGQFAPLPAAYADYDCRNNRLLRAVLDQVAPGLRELRQRIPGERIAVIIGTSTSGIREGEDAVEALERNGKWPATFHYRQQEIGTASLFAARYLQLDGPRYTISTACTSSAKAFASARRLIIAGRCDAAVVGGSDSLCRLTLNGFDSLESLSPGVCKPFSANRDGINIGEGACVFVVSKEPGPVELLGVGESSDGYHMSAPDPSGRGAEMAVRAALSMAGIEPGAVGYINLHGTATPKNDAMESIVVARVFGCDTPCTSTKPLTGHVLGAAGAQELGLCWLLLANTERERVLPMQCWDSERDPALPPIGLVGTDTVWTQGVFMSNSFAFGGSNASVIIGSRQ